MLIEADKILIDKIITYIKKYNGCTFLEIYNHFKNNYTSLRISEVLDELVATYFIRIKTVETDLFQPKYFRFYIEEYQR